MTFQIAPDVPVMRLPRDGSNAGADINGFMAWCLGQGVNAAKLAPGCATIEVPIDIPGSFDLIGLGRADELNNQSSGLSPLDWGGGVKLLQPASGGTVLRAIGQDNGNSVAGMLNGVGIHNIAVAGRAGFDRAMASGGAGWLVDIQNALRCDLDLVCTGAPGGHVRLRNIWDTRISRLRSILGGFSDRSVTADSAVVQSYIGRAFTAMETALKRSLGVPAVWIDSPNTVAGMDVSNNLRFHDLHIEASICNGVPLLITGANAIQISAKGKIESIDGTMPLVAAEGMYGLDLDLFLHGAGRGQAPCAFGGTPAGFGYAADPCPALVLLNACHGVRLNGEIGWVNGSPALLAAFVRATDGSGLYGDLRVRDGLANLTGAMLSVDAGCTDTDGLRFHLPPSVAGVAGANTTRMMTR